ncbi:MAG: class II fructose-bisphosphate aldolase [Candidatus Omnitrophota bacterium]
MDIDNLVRGLVLSEDREKKQGHFLKIWQAAQERNIYPASIHNFYIARGRGDFDQRAPFSVPAINLRVLTYDLARAIIRVARRQDAAAFIFEIAKSEMGYTAQRPLEYCGVCLAAAIKEGYSGPIFIQADHTQVNSKKYNEDPAKELNNLKALIKEAIDSGFYNIDIDSSTLVDLSKKDKKEEQRLNFEACVELTKYIRGIQPEGVVVSVGGEIGEVGQANSTPEELEAFMGGYNELVGQGAGISKVSVQTGTSHGGVVLPDGSIARVQLDFETLRVLSELARKKYGLGGAVQHGASTLPDNAFGKFPAVGTLEVHLATQFQNMVYESKAFPDDLRNRMYAWIKENLAGEKKEGESEEQFIYKTRKKALGAFKKDLVNLPDEIHDKIGQELEEKFEFLFKQLNIAGTKDRISKYAPRLNTQPRLSHSGDIDASGAD